ncbi:MAG: serine/threonine protein kinase [Coriobacteriia bacterium]|nr:serine/threonine protein kinase [Coriobacteriia bacterium]
MTGVAHEFTGSVLRKVSVLSEKSHSKTYLMQDAEGVLYTKKMLSKQQAKVYEHLQAIVHPNLSETLAIGEEDGKYFVIQNYVEGETLAARLDGENISEGDAVRLICQLCLVLDKIHQRGIIHRDVTPDNIIITPENRLVLIDFGIARTHKEEQSQDTQTLGTPGYAAPEQFGFAQTSASSDIFALGVLFNVMLTGKKPHEKQVDSERLAAIIQSCTSIDPSARYQDVLQIDYDLRQMSLPAIDDGQEVAPVSTQRANKILIAAIVALSCCMIVLLIFVFNLASDDSSAGTDLATTGAGTPIEGQGGGGIGADGADGSRIDIAQLSGRWINGSGDNLERPLRGTTSFAVNLDEVEFLEDGTVVLVFKHRDGHNIETTSIWQLNDTQTLLVVEGSEYTVGIEGNILTMTDSEGGQRLWQRSGQ